MKTANIKFNKLKLLGTLGISCLGYLAFISPHESVEAAKSVATHIGTFEGSTTFTTSSSNGINPGLFIEVMDKNGVLTQYESEDGVITVPNTKAGTYVTQAKLLGKTKYVDEDTGEMLDDWEEGRNLKLASVEDPVLFTSDHRPTVIPYSAFENAIISNGEGWTKFDLQLTLTDVDCYVKLNKPVDSGRIKLKIEGFEELDNNSGIAVGVEYTKRLDSVSYVSFYDWSLIFNGYRPDLVLDYLKEGVLEISFLKEGMPLYPSYAENSKSSILSANEDVVLRGIGDVRDELDLITGEVTERIGEITVDGSENWTNSDVHDRWYTKRYILELDGDIFKNYPVESSNDDFLANFKRTSPVNRDVDEQMITIIYWEGADDSVSIRVNKSLVNSLTDFKIWLSQNPISIQYKLFDESIKTIPLTSTYCFETIREKVVEVTGTILPLVGSLIVPSEVVSFTINPNQEVGQQFLAPEFSITNETRAPLCLILKSFEQTTDVFNDVLPEAHESWEGLNKQESKDIALALVPKAGDGWLSLNEEPRYVADTLNNDLGVIKAKSTVDFTFSALHGQAFEEVLNPSYRLGFVFEFMN